jgi:hypothetical protein
MTDDSGPAYPCSQDLYGGLTKREIFAAAALQGLLASGPHDCTYQELALDAVKNADALIAALQEPAK